APHGRVWSEPANPINFSAIRQNKFTVPQGKSIAGDYISCLVLRRNPIAGVSTMGGLLTYDWPPAQAVGVLLQKSKKKDVPERRLRVEERDRRTVKEKHRRGCPRC